MANMCFNTGSAPFHRLSSQHVADFFNKTPQPSCLAPGRAMDCFFLVKFHFQAAALGKKQFSDSFACRF